MSTHRASEKPCHIRAAAIGALVAILAGGATALLPGGVAYADGYYNNWPGHPEVNYSYQGKIIGSNLQKFLPAPLPGLQSEFNSAWKANEPAVCGEIEDYLLRSLGSFKEWKCNLPPGGDLQGALVGPNRLGLDFQLTGIAISLDYLAGGIDWVTINGTFNAQLQVTMDVASSINWGDESQSPVSIASSQVSFWGANFSSANVLLHIFAPNALSDAADRLDSTVIPGVATMLGLGPDISTLNAGLDTAATSIADLYVLPEYPFAAQGFSLTLGVDNRHASLTFGRGGSPEAPPRNCSFYSDVSGFAPNTTEVDATCSPKQARGVNSLVLQEQRHGVWTDNPNDAQYEPGDPTSWTSQLAAPPYGAWQPNNGPGSGYAPSMTDYPRIQKDSPTVQMRVCSSNQWGLNCTPANAVAQATDDGGGSGGGGGGGGGAGGVGGGGGGGYGGGASPITGTGGHVSKYE